MQIVLWLAICAIIAVASVKRPALSISVVVITAVLVPYVASDIIVGNVNPDLHPATWLILVCVVVSLFTHPLRLLEQLSKHPFLYLLLGVALGGIFISTYGVGGGYGISIVINQVGAPVLLFLLAGAAFDERPQALIVLRNVVLALAAIEAVLSIVGALSGGQLLYVTFYERQYWFDATTSTRALGTVDDSLTLSLILSACIPLAASLKGPRIQIPLVGLLLIAILLTQSRTGLFVGAAGVIYLFVRRDVSFSARFGTVVGAIALTVTLFLSGIAGPVLDRLVDDGGSASGRSNSVDAFVQNAGSFLLLGRGATSSYDFSREQGLGTSLESAFLMYSVDFGLLFVVVFFGSLFVTALRGWTRGHLPGAGVAAFIAVATCQSFSSIAGDNAGGIFIWLLAAMAFTRFTPPTGAEDTASDEAALESARVIPSGRPLNRYTPR